MYPMGCSAPKFYSFLRSTSQTPPQAYSVHQWIGHLCVAKVLTKILKPLVVRSPHHIHSTQDFEEQANKITLPPEECLSSCDITALLTSITVKPALSILKDLLEQDIP